MLKILVLILFITTHTYAQNIVVENYCFSSTAESLKAQASSKYLMLPADSIEAKGECFSLFTTETRRELIQRYLRNNYPQLTVTFSSAERSADEMCSLKVEKIKNSNSTQTNAQVKTFGSVNVGNSSSSGKEVSQIKVMSGSSFELQVDTQKISGKCRFINSSRFEIEFSMLFIPKPITPPVPDGVIVVLENPPLPEVQQGTSLSTTVQIGKGDRLEIGSIVKDLNEKGVQASLTPQLSYEKTEGQSTEKIYLLVD